MGNEVIADENGCMHLFKDAAALDGNVEVVDLPNYTFYDVEGFVLSVTNDDPKGRHFTVTKTLEQKQNELKALIIDFLIDKKVDINHNQITLQEAVKLVLKFF